MARKRGEYQKRQERRMRNGIVCGLLLFVVTILLCIYGIVESKYTIQQIDNGALMQYTGKYSYEYVNRRMIFSRRHSSRRSSYYKFTLDNGVAFTLSAGSQYCEVLDANPVIYVRYIQEPFRNQYIAVSVATADGTVTLRSLESSRKSNVSLIWGCSIVIVFCSLFSIFCLILLFEKRINQFQRWRKKRRKILKKQRVRNEDALTS